MFSSKALLSATEPQREVRGVGGRVGGSWLIMLWKLEEGNFRDKW